MSRPHASVASAKSRVQAASAAASNHTLDLRHQTEMKRIQDVTKELNYYKDRLQYLVSNNNTFNSKRESEIRVCLSNIQALSLFSDELTYLEQTGDILFQYYSLIDRTERVKITDSEQANTVSTKGILSYFVKPQTSDEKQEEYDDYSSDTTDEESEVNDNDNDEDSEEENTDNIYGPSIIYPDPSSVPFIQKDTSELDRASLLDRYMVYTDINHVSQSLQPVQPLTYTRSSSMMMMGASSPHAARNILMRGLGDDKEQDSASKDDPDRCPACGSKNRRVYHHDGLVSCNDCHVVDHAMIDHDRPSYKDPPKEISYFAYKRINHFQEWISQIQGKESTEIPDQLFDRILLEIKKQKITNMATLTRTKLREILKILKANKYYEHVPYLINRLNGLPSPHFGHELEETLRSMFRQIQPLFLKYAPSHRKNFLSYSYVLHKFIQLLERDEFLHYFPLLKSREKLHAQDMIWKKICAELQWQYIPSV
jgi:hypothetical protein